MSDRRPEDATEDPATTRSKPGPKAGRRAELKRPPRRRSQAERRDASKKGLLKAALALIAERGFRGTSFQAIAVRAGYSPSLVSHRFGSKEGLLAELVRRMLHRWGTDVRAAAIVDRIGTDALEAVAHAHHNALDTTPSTVRALYMLLFESLIDAPALRKEFAQLDENLRQSNAGLLRAGIDAGEVRADIDVDAQATLFLAMLRGITLQWLVDPASLDLPRVYAALDQLLDRGLRR